MFLDADKKKWLSDRFKASVKFDELMSRHTSFRVGGPAKVFVKPESFDDLSLLVRWAADNKIPYMIIGSGTNILVKDKGIQAIIISLASCFNEISITGREKDKVIITAGAGTKLHSLCSFAIKNFLKGMNFALGIPGTVGGAVMMNAGTARGTISSVLHEITILQQDGKKKTITGKEIKPEYRKMIINKEGFEFNRENAVILYSSFLLNTCSDLNLKKEADLIMAEREKRQPTTLPSAGCFFKNPDSNTPAARLIDAAELKGTVKGGAMISPKHANFIVNVNNSSAADILALSEIIYKQVQNKFNIKLVPEVIIIGE